MATYMLSYRFTPEEQDEAIERFMEGSALEEPEGIESVARWHSAVGGRGWNVIETDDPKHLTDWVLNWSDLIQYEVTPVINDEELGEVFVKHGHG